LKGRPAATAALAVPVDVSDQAQVRAMTHEAVNHFGNLDILFNNAGIGASIPFAEQTAEDGHQPDQPCVSDGAIRHRLTTASPPTPAPPCSFGPETSSETPQVLIDPLTINFLM
jgi:hypothetical protein